MIKGLHAMFSSPKAEEVRAFLRDKLELPFTDTGDGWLIFDVPAADLGSHPAEHPSHELSFRCEDINATVEELKGRGVEFSKEVTDAGWGFITSFKLPDDSEIALYEPKYQK